MVLRGDLVQEDRQDMTGNPVSQETQDLLVHQDIQVIQEVSYPLTWLEDLMKNQGTWQCCMDHRGRQEQEARLGQTACRVFRDLKDPLEMLVTLGQWEIQVQGVLRVLQENLVKMVKQVLQGRQER